VGVGSISDAVRVAIPPLDLNKDGVPDFLGKEVTFNVTRLGQSIPTIVLSSAPAGALAVQATNIAAFMGKTGNRVLSSASGPLFLVFNWPLDAKLTELALSYEQGKTTSATTTKTITGNHLAISFQNLNAGAEYNLNVRAFANAEGTQLEGSFGAPFFTPSPAGTKVQAALKRGDSKTPNRVYITFSEPVGTGQPGQSLTGANAVLFFDHDLNGSGTKGDAAGERGAATTNLQVLIDETQPPGAAGLSGLSKYWMFDLPLDTMNNPVPGGTPFDLVFSRMNLAMQRADGTTVPDMLNLTVPN
jgi:hypothetical protein